MTALAGEFAEQCDGARGVPRSVGISTAGSRVTGVHGFRSQRPSIPVRRQYTCPSARRIHSQDNSAGSPPLTLTSRAITFRGINAMPDALSPGDPFGVEGPRSPGAVTFVWLRKQNITPERSHRT